MNSTIKVVIIAALLSASAALAQTDKKQKDRTEAEICKPKVNKCVSLCVRYNPLNICNSFCKPRFLCDEAK